MTDILQHLTSEGLDVAVYRSVHGELAYSFKWYQLTYFGNRIQVLSIAEVHRMIDAGALKFIKDLPEGHDQVWNSKLYGFFPNPRIMRLAKSVRHRIKMV